ncbi:unnamed protein product, partial [Phaeothamnion confervicola]
LQFGAEDLGPAGAYPASGCPQVREMVFSGDRRWLLAHGHDRVVRLLPTVSSSGGGFGGGGGGIGGGGRELQDVVNRVRWQCCCFSGDSEHVVAGTRDEYSYVLYVWTIEGQLTQRIDGPQV